MNLFDSINSLVKPSMSMGDIGKFRGELRKVLKEYEEERNENCIFHWEPDLENLSDEIIGELNWLAEVFPGSSDHLFSWSDEDNEDCPILAEYIVEKYNAFRFIIDMRGVIDRIEEMQVTSSAGDSKNDPEKLYSERDGCNSICLMLRRRISSMTGEDLYNNRSVIIDELAHRDREIDALQRQVNATTTANSDLNDKLSEINNQNEQLFVRVAYYDDSSDRHTEFVEIEDANGKSVKVDTFSMHNQQALIGPIYRNPQAPKSRLELDGVPSFYFSVKGLPTCTHRMNESDIPIWVKTAEQASALMDMINNLKISAPPGYAIVHKTIIPEHVVQAGERAINSFQTKATRDLVVAVFTEMLTKYHD